MPAIATSHDWPPARIKALRSALGESVSEFGARFGRSGRTVEDWEQPARQRRLDPLVLRELSAIVSRRKIAV